MSVLKEYINSQSTSIIRFFGEQLIFLFFQNIPTSFGVFLRNIFYKLIIKNKGFLGIEDNVKICHSANLRLGRNVFIGRNVYLGASDGGIKLGNNVFILENCYLNVFNYHKETKGKSKIILGNDVVLSSGCILHGHSGIYFGDKTIVGPNSIFVSAGHGEISKNTEYRIADIKRTKPIKIGNNVWIGTSVKVLPGISIGDGCVIGAGSVVTKDFPAYVVAAGNPAKVLRKIK